MAITHIYGAVGVFGICSDVTFVDAWPWMAFQTLLRIEDIAMCVLVVLISTKTPRATGIGKLLSTCRGKLYFVFHIPGNSVGSDSTQRTLQSNNGQTLNKTSAVEVTPMASNLGPGKLTLNHTNCDVSTISLV